MTPHLDILPAPQLEFWHQHAAAVPHQWVLYGGTGVALWLGHRLSIDFDFFSSSPLQETELRRALPILDSSTVLTKAPGTLVVSCPLTSGEVKLSFFGGLKLGRVGTPVAMGPIRVADRLDLLAIKLKVIHDRVEVKDYLDIEALLRSGLDLTRGIFAAHAIYGDALNPLDTAKAVCWFKDGGLMTKLTEESRAYLTSAAASFDAGGPEVPLAARSLDEG